MAKKEKRVRIGLDLSSSKKPQGMAVAASKGFRLDPCGAILNHLFGIDVYDLQHYRDVSTLELEASYGEDLGESVNNAAEFLSDYPNAILLLEDMSYIFADPGSSASKEAALRAKLAEIEKKYSTFPLFEFFHSPGTRLNPRSTTKQRR